MIPTSFIFSTTRTPKRLSPPSVFSWHPSPTMFLWL